jgi:hypothetical protein
MMRLPRQGAFRDDEYQLLYSLADAVSELMRKHASTRALPSTT